MRVMHKTKGGGSNLPPLILPGIARVKQPGELFDFFSKPRHSYRTLVGLNENTLDTFDYVIGKLGLWFV